MARTLQGVLLGALLTLLQRVQRFVFGCICPLHLATESHRWELKDEIIGLDPIMNLHPQPGKHKSSAETTAEWCFIADKGFFWLREGDGASCTREVCSQRAPRQHRGGFSKFKASLVIPCYSFLTSSWPWVQNNGPRVPLYSVCLHIVTRRAARASPSSIPPSHPNAGLFCCLFLLF